MKFKIHKSALEDILSKVYPIIPTKSTIPILSNILIECKKNKMAITATDLEASSIASIDTEIIEEGEIAINGKDLYNLIRELPSAVIDFNVENLLTTIKCETGSYTLPGINKDEYPQISEIKEGNKVFIPYDIIKMSIGKTIFASLTGEVSSILNGGLLDLREDEFRFVATDGHRLALYKNKIDNKKVSKIVLPIKVWTQVSKFLSGVEIIFDDKRASFYSDNMIVVSRLMEGEYPPYEGVIPKNNDKIIIINKEKIIDSLRRVIVFAPGISKLVKFMAKNNSLLIESTSEKGEAKEVVPCKYNGPQMEIGYNGDYLLSIFTRIDTDDIKFSFKDSLSAALIEPIEQKVNEEIIYLLMPIRLE